MSEPLFPGYPDPPEPPKQTPGERIRARQQLQLDAGVHPLTKLPLADNGHTCRDCVHRVRNERHYPKCDLTPMSRCVQGDCRAWWPACTSWSAKDEAPP